MDVGKTPLQDLSVEAGARTVALALERYLPQTQPLEVTGRSVRQQLKLELAPGWADVTIDSKPAGASILVDGETAGTTPATLQIMGGERQLILQLPAYADAQQALLITPGKPQQLKTIELQPAAGVLKLSSAPSGANVTLDGEFQGQTPMNLEVSPDKVHRLAVFKPGYRRYNGTVQLPAAGQDSRTVTLSAELGEVRFNISPASAVLKIDGKVRGTGSQTLSLPAFEHSVEISLPGHTTVTPPRHPAPRPAAAGGGQPGERPGSPPGSATRRKSPPPWGRPCCCSNLPTRRWPTSPWALRAGSPGAAPTRSCTPCPCAVPSTCRPPR